MTFDLRPLVRYIFYRASLARELGMVPGRVVGLNSLPTRRPGISNLFNFFSFPFHSSAYVLLHDLCYYSIKMQSNNLAWRFELSGSFEL